MTPLRQWLGTPKGKAVLGSAAITLAGVDVRMLMGYFRNGTPDVAHYTMFICTETGTTSSHRNRIGEAHPILSPHSNKNTGVPAEPRFWTADGGTRNVPTWVLLIELPGKDRPTFCPDCSRLMQGHNPPPGINVQPPPARDQYRPRSRGRGYRCLSLLKEP